MAKIDMPNNSEAAKAKQQQPTPEKEVKKVIKGNVKTRSAKQSRVAEELISDDVHHLGDYMLFDILIPAAKKAISDIVTDGIDILLYGESQSHRRRGGGTPRVSYSSYYDSPRRDRDRDREERVRYDSRSYSYDNVVLESRKDAEDVLSSMLDIIDNYGIVSVADLYELVGITGRYTDINYGWTNLASADVSRVRDGYLIRLPKPSPLN